MTSSSQSPVTSHQSRMPAVAVTLALAAAYALTLAPSITPWDSAEFNAAVGSLGTPHPPGTPLYILIGKVWSLALWFLPQALAMNLLSAAATALACGLIAGLIARWTGSLVAGIAAGLSSGTMLSVWQNATETEVYALALLLSILMVVAGDRAGRSGASRHRILLAFLMALAVPLQISALVAAPAAIMLASHGQGSAAAAWRSVGTSGGAFLTVVGAGLVQPWLVAAGAGLLLATAVRHELARREAVAIVAVIAIGLSPALFMLVRAAHDPLVNQGNPATWQAWLDVIARRQYDVPGLWPRRAPAWIQLLNLLQYGDWQVASGLDDGVAASWTRTPWSVAALALAVVGARQHRARHAASLGPWAVLLASASLGVVAVLNLRAGPSILDAVLPPGATHEPRERDYFFALAFAAAGAWIGIGAAVLARRWTGTGRPRRSAAVALAFAALPLVLNWKTASRAHPVTASLAPAYGEALLASVPPDALLILAGDNDSYPVWYRQAVLHDRLDVVPVTSPLLGATWYREELARRHGLLDAGAVAAWAGEEETIKALVASARRAGRPVAVSLAMPPTSRDRIATAWSMQGVALVEDTKAPLGIAIDSTRTAAIADLLVRRVPAGEPAGRDPALRWIARLLRCPGAVLADSAGLGATTLPELLDSKCNLK